MALNKPATSSSLSPSPLYTVPLQASSFALTLSHSVPKLTSKLAPAHRSFTFALKHKPDAIHTYSAPSVPVPRTTGTATRRPPAQSGLFAFPSPLPLHSLLPKPLHSPAAVPQVPRRSWSPHLSRAPLSLLRLTQSSKHSSSVITPSEAPLTRSFRWYSPGLPARSTGNVSHTVLPGCRPCF